MLGEADSELSQFQANLAAMEDRKFEQPIFGANHIAGRVPSPAPVTAAHAFVQFELYFPRGGSDSFFTLLIHAEAKAKAKAAVRQRDGQCLCMID